MLARLAEAAFEPSQEVVLLADDLAAAGQQTQAAALAGPMEGVARIVEYQPERVVVEATLDAPGALVLADTWYPGWQARIDGQPAPVLRANYLFRAVLLPAGQHVVQFEFRPASLRLGAGVSLAAALLLLAVVILGPRAQHRGES